MCRAHLRVTSLSSYCQTIFADLQLGRSIVQCQQHGMRHQRAIEPTWYGLAGPVRALIELLAEWGMRIRLRKYITISVLVKWMLERIAVRR